MNNIKRLVEAQFIKKECDLSNPSVVAAIITAASKMARLSNIASEMQTVDCLVDLYGAQDNTLVGSMPPQYVSMNIGYDIDFEDIGHASIVYDADAENYNKVYSAIKEYVDKREYESSKTM